MKELIHTCIPDSNGLSNCGCSTYEEIKEEAFMKDIGHGVVGGGVRTWEEEFDRHFASEAYDRGDIEATDVCNLNMEEIHKHYRTEIEKIIDEIDFDDHDAIFSIIEDLTQLTGKDTNVPTKLIK